MKKRIFNVSAFAICMIFIAVAAKPKTPLPNMVAHEKPKAESKPFSTCDPVTNIHAQHVGMTLIIYFTPPTTQYNNFTYQGYSFPLNYGHLYSGTTGQSGFQVFPWTWGGSVVKITSHCTCQPYNEPCDSSPVSQQLP
jgi:hypothetical protein